MTDSVTKLLLAAIALGLWANAAAHMVQPAKAQSSNLDKNLMDSMSSINTNLGSVDGHLAVFIKDLQLIMAGRCQNRQLCRRT